MFRVAFHEGLHALDDSAQPIALQAVLVGECGFSQAEADEVADVLLPHLNEIAWARAGAALASVLQRAAEHNGPCAGLARALGVLPGSLSEAAAAAGCTKQSIHNLEHRFRRLFADWTATALASRRERKATQKAHETNAKREASHGWRSAA